MKHKMILLPRPKNPRRKAGTYTLDDSALVTGYLFVDKSLLTAEQINAAENMIISGKMDEAIQFVKEIAKAAGRKNR